MDSPRCSSSPSEPSRTKVAPPLSAFVFGGYLITRRITRPPWVTWSLDAADDEIVTASDCLAEFLPDVWALSWTDDTKSRDQALASFGIDPSRVDELVALVDDLFNQKRLLWTRFLTDRQAVAAVRQAAYPSTECKVLGLGLHRDLVESYIENEGVKQDPESMLVGLLSKELPIPEQGVPLGFEILGFELGASSAHSWLCCGLQGDLEKRYGVRPGPKGLLSDYGLANQWADEITREQLGEPVLWLPWLLVEYPGFGETDDVSAEAR